MKYKTISGNVLTRSAAVPAAAIPKNTIESLFAAAGHPAAIAEITAAPQVITYHLQFANPLEFKPAAVRKVVTALNMRYHCRAMLTPSNIADIAIQAARQPRQDVNLFDAVNTAEYCSIAGTRSAAAIGIDSDNKPVCIDIASAPHVLIAGTTGSGKSVLMNSIICSLLMTCTPLDGRFIMIDPKQVEFMNYSRLPHLFRPIVTDSAAAVDILESLAIEMDKRYKQLARRGLKSAAEMPAGSMPRLYVFIDELADLMLTSRKAVEPAIVRIAQLGRAAGIHLIVATQKPIKTVITGLIKANMPVKIALTVSNVNDSVLILGHSGAEKLTGRGDALLQKPAAFTDLRFQSAYTPEIDIQTIINHYRKQAGILFRPH